MSTPPDILNIPLSVAYQPVITLRTEIPQVYAYECLMRVPSEPFGSPQRLIEYAEAHGHMNALDMKIARMVCLDAIANPRMRVWLNLSQASLECPVTARRISRLIDAARLQDRITVEITESMDGCELAITENLELLNRMAVGVVIDDIQDAHAKVNLLKTHLIRGCKLSRKTTIQLGESPSHFARTTKLVEWCKDNDKTVVLEGIETTKEIDLAYRLGVDYCQGYYFWPAMDIRQLPDQGLAVTIPESIRRKIPA